MLSNNQRPRIQHIDNHLVIILKTIANQETEKPLEELIIVLCDGYLATFLDDNHDILSGVSSIVHQNTNNIRSLSADHLCYIILSAAIKEFSYKLDQETEEIDQITEIPVSSDPKPHLIQKIEATKKRILTYKRSLSPLMEIINKIESEDYQVIKKETRKYFSDLKSDLRELNEAIENNLQQLSSASNLFFSIQGYRMNQIMRTLTIVSTIFIPLTFITGIYGMNFKNMPELNHTYSYYICLSFMFLLSLGMIIYFFKRKLF